MIKEYWLKLTDARLGAVLYALAAPGQAMGDLVNAPGLAPVFFRPLRARLDSAKNRPSSPAASEALGAAEDFAARLEKTFTDMALLSVAPDPAAREAALCLQRACLRTGALLSVRGRAGAAAEIKAFCATGRRALSSAKAASDRAPSDFPLNLKFSSIYSGFDAAFDAFERCTEALFRV